MTWRVGKKRYRRKTGPVPDSQLQPIRELRPRDPADGVYESVMARAALRAFLATVADSLSAKVKNLDELGDDPHVLR